MDLINMPTFGIAGNFTGHLDQAGEAKDFEKVKTEDQNAPKAVFPTYIPILKKNISKLKTPEFLTIFPFNPEKIIFPKGETKLQLEPECALIFNVKWEQDKIISLTPIYFGASNDCSIRKEGAKKISEKKNWCKASKGLSSNLIKIDSFNSSSDFNNYNIASFLIRDNQIYEYGINSCVKDYNYIYEKLINWLIQKLNFQKDEGPAEDIHSYLIEAEKPNKIMVSIGATRYTKWGEKNYLMNNDKTAIILYPNNKYSKKDIIKFIKNNDFSDKSISALIQTVEL